MSTLHKSSVLPEHCELKTSRLVLSPVRIADVEVLWPLVSDARLTQFLAWEPHQEINETIAMVRSLVDAQETGKGFHWILRQGATAVGLVSLIDVRRQHRSWTINRAELAYWIAPDYHGQGLATEASRAVVQCGFLELALNKIIVYHAADNPPSGHVVRKLGFRFVGAEKDAFSKNGEWHDLWHFEMLRSEYESQVKFKP